MELRALHNCELRAIGSHRLEGYAAVFNSLSEPLGFGFRETIRPGAFTRTLNAGADVRALVDHDPSKILGRTTAGTLSLEQDARGLHTIIDLPDTTTGRDVYESVKRGDLSQMSFGFSVIEDAWPERNRRELVHVNLFDVSVVSFPAYPETSVSARGAAGGTLQLGWYIGQHKTIVVPDVTEMERLKLRLKLAQQL